MPPVVLKHGLLALWLSDKSVRTRVTRAHDLLTSVVTPDLCVDKLAVSSVGVCLHSGVSTPRWTRHGLSADTMNTTTTVSGAHGKGDTLESSSLDKILANTQCADYVGMPLTIDQFHEYANGVSRAYITNTILIFIVRSIISHYALIQGYCFG